MEKEKKKKDIRRQERKQKRKMIEMHQDTSKDMDKMNT